MGLKVFKPVTPGTRFYSVSDFKEVTASKPHPGLTLPKKKSGGRNNTGRITSRHRGGGHKQKYRIIDFKRANKNVTGVVETIEYDPNRTCRIALVKFANEEYRYVLAWTGAKVGDVIVSSDTAELKDGNTLP